MGSRTMAVDCERCGGVLDWGDFGPDPDDGSVGATCTCPPKPDLVAWLQEQAAYRRRRAEELHGTNAIRAFTMATAYEHVIAHITSRDAP